LSAASRPTMNDGVIVMDGGDIGWVIPFGFGAPPRRLATETNGRAVSAPGVSG
jgi:hypothetical protein